MKAAIENPDVRAVEDAAWDVKDVLADLVSRALSDADLAVLASVRRDLERLHERVVEVRDRRRRKRNEVPVATAVDEQPEPQEPAT